MCCHIAAKNTHYELFLKSPQGDFVHWCDNNHLKVNVSKTQEIIFDAKCIVADHLPVVIHGEEIAQIGQYKYLGVHLDNKLSWNVHVHSVCSKVHQRLYFLRRQSFSC